MILNPICPKCGFELAAKIGTKIIVCVVCNTEYKMVQIRHVIKKKLQRVGYLPDIYNEFGTINHISPMNKKSWK